MDAKRYLLAVDGKVYNPLVDAKRYIVAIHEHGYKESTGNNKRELEVYL